MYGLIGKLNAVPGSRDVLVQALLRMESMPGCVSYVVGVDTEDANGVWVTELWESEEHHAASLQLPEVQAVIEEGRPVVAGFEVRATTTPMGGIGFRPIDF